MHNHTFQNTIWNYYKKHGRKLPWRNKSTTPYHILVSEIMLQQTQVDRVLPKYKAFLKQFPNFKKLNQSKQSEVLKLWQGLGYNRRALNLHKTAQIVRKKYNGQLPKDTETLLKLPGIGSYTASALRAFAYNIPDTMIETNIRTTYIYYYFFKKVIINKQGGKVHDRELLPLIEKSLPAGRQVREWYWALMDYGSHLKKTVGNTNVQSTHYTKQSKFAGSNRQLRGNIIKLLTEKPVTLARLTKILNIENKKTAAVATELQKEGFIVKNGQTLSLA